LFWLILKLFSEETFEDKAAIIHRLFKDIAELAFFLAIRLYLRARGSLEGD